ncbi:MULTISPECIES: lytic transglycosylase domain-containing protein [unclassified Cellulophaga]|uniref:lytic transglycosylase domain-containing protein n=1 Tax=unclassified Cellulophaga TaxID=2634405 RepID=UPI000C2C9384|nr:MULTISPECIES: lytic transglycosylase domain-containing protein [unclassified Cellulophaga]MDO6492110.1 lytic transglycosylase domain-containing protein [Cellulophaga sp. 2_MG-2023]MDO6495729.1 lytic transglycosylase domain-containing protein [Cellulophaga sp. 3_MG-2023]
MKIVKSILMFLGVVLVAGSLMFAVQSTSVIPQLKEDVDVVTPENGYKVTSIDIPADLNFAGEAVPLTDPEVMERIDREFLVNTYWQSNALLLMKRANKYFPIIEPILAKNGVPDDFKYLAVAESGLQNVVSPAGATGFWQIMRATGKEYGLEVNSNVDERYHIQKSTEVACKYLKKYKNKFGNWTLAAASYNAGAGAINKYLTQQKVDSYYDLLLGQETGRYLFRIMAIKEILSAPEKYGFEISEDEMYKAVPSFTVDLDVPVSNFADFANEYEINYKILKRHNPWLREPHLNNNSRKKYTIEIPNKGYYKVD